MTPFGPPEPSPLLTTGPHMEVRGLQTVGSLGGWSLVASTLLQQDSAASFPTK